MSQTSDHIHVAAQSDHIAGSTEAVWQGRRYPVERLELAGARRLAQAQDPRLVAGRSVPYRISPAPAVCSLAAVQTPVRDQLGRGSCWAAVPCARRPMPDT